MLDVATTFWVTFWITTILREPVFNVSARRVAGIRFLKVGRLTVSWSVGRAYRPIRGGMSRV